MRLHTQRLPGLVLTDHEFDVPLRHDRPDGQQLSVYAREVARPDKLEENLPWLVFLQGGPGFGSPRPTGRTGWIARALDHYRVLLLDQRGTGRSSPVNFQSLARFETPEQQADHLACFRADAIVHDCEHIRRELLGPAEPWSVLGQSYGGFCTVTYLSSAPSGLREGYVTGGLPPLRAHPDDIYRATYARVRGKNAQYYNRYPEDVERVREIVAMLRETNVQLPGGGRLTPRRFQQLGLSFGFSDGYEAVHYLIEQAFVDGARGREPRLDFLRGVENHQHYETNPIFAILHEAAYCQGFASNWSAQRIRDEFPEFDPDTDDHVLFTGEMIYPWMFDEYERLRPLKRAAEILAHKDDWDALYDENTLANNTVPCAAVIYCNDMYVERRFSEQTADSIAGLRRWTTDEFEHNGLRAHGEHVLGRLFDMLRGEA